MDVNNRLSPNDKILHAIEVIQKSMIKMVVICDNENKLLGSITDGDIRRCLLNGGSLETFTCEAMNKEPIFAYENTSFPELFAIMKRENIFAIPLLNKNNHYSHLIDIKEVASKENITLDNHIFEFAVIMAGGLGSRLRPLTNDIPKPMIKVGGIPLLERQIRLLKNFGIKKIYLSVNYLSDIIQEYFGDGSNLDIEINYLKEKQKTGTAGSLSLLNDIPNIPFLVLNGDILTNFDLKGLYEFHLNSNSDITIASVDYKISVPYGTLNVDGLNLIEIVEKPKLRFLCNAGIYALEKKCLDRIPKDIEFNMTDLINSYIDAKEKISVFPLFEYWMDIGNMDDLNKAKEFFKN